MSIAASWGEQLAQSNNFGDTVPAAIAGPTGLFLILALGAATVFLIVNMNKRLKKLPHSFDSDKEKSADKTDPPA